MNVTPSDKDVRQGYIPAASASAQGSTSADANAAPKVSKPDDAEAKTAGVGAAEQLSEALTTDQKASDANPSESDGAADSYSKQVAAAADKTTAKETAAKLGSQLETNNTGLKIRVLDDNEHTIQVEIVDKASNKVLRKIPQDEIIKLSASMKEMTGVLLNKPA